MSTRSSISVVTFSHAFCLSGYSDTLPAGDYEVVVEEEVLLGLSFEAYRRTGTYLTVPRKGVRAGRTEMRQTTERDLQMAVNRDRLLAADKAKDEAAPYPLEDLK